MNKQPCYLLIGGSGFLGSAFSAYLQTQGKIAKVINRGDLSDSKSLQYNEQLTNQLGVSEVQNIVIDFAYTSVPNTSFSDPVKDFSENLYNVNSHLAFAAKLPNPSYIYISSGGTVYGNVVNHAPVKESDQNFPLSPYGITKLASEKYTLMYKAIHGLDVKIVRPANIYGPGQKPFRGQGFISTALAKVLHQQPIQIFGDGTAIRDYLFVEEFNQALFQLVTYGFSGDIYNVGSEKGYSTNRLLGLISEALQMKPEVEYLPARPFDVQYNVLDCSKLRSIGNWNNTTALETGIAATLAWLRQANV